MPFLNGKIDGFVINHLASGCHVVSDGLPGFAALKLAGCKHTVIITGGGATSIKNPEFKWVNTIIANVKRAFNGTCHAISKKHFPRYLTEF